MAETALVTAPTPSSSGPRPVSPAAHLAERFAAAEVTGARAVSLREVPFLTMVGLRVVPGSAAAGRIETCLTARLPISCGEVSIADGLSVLWLAPDEFLAVSGDHPATEVTLGLLEALDGGPGSVTDLSANRTTFELTGASSRAVLEKGCPLDLHPRSFAVNQAYVTLIGSVPVVLRKTADETYQILPRSSYADFLGRWLIDAMAEFKVSELP
jgi:sarcosine oxidase subunit gamma